MKKRPVSLIRIILILILAAGAFAAVWFLVPEMIRAHNDTAGLGMVPVERDLAEDLKDLVLNRKKIVYSLNSSGSADVKLLVAMEEERRIAEEQERARREAEEEEARLHAEPFTIAFAGDILFDPYYAVGQTMAANGGFAACLDEQTLDTMRSADMMVINNEFPYTQNGAPLEGKTYTFHAPPYTAAWLADAGIDLAALANNHIFDYGEQGFLDTLDALDSAGIPYFGAGRDIEEASRIVYYTVGRMTVALLNCTQIEKYPNSETRAADDSRGGVFKCLDPSLMYSRVREARENADFVIVFIHWGTEKESMADQLQREQAAGLAQAGADLVVGAHPHRVQGVEYYGDTPVAYSIGNFLFTSYTLDVSLLEVTLDPDTQSMLSLRMIPMQQVNSRVRTLDGTEKERFIRELREISRGALIDEDGYISKQ